MSALAQQTMATIGVGGQRRRRRAGPVGFRALGSVNGIWDDVTAAISGAKKSASKLPATGGAGGIGPDGNASGSVWGDVTATVDGVGEGQSTSQTIFDALTLKGLRDVATSQGTETATAAAKTLLDAGNATKESANAALKFLADNGNLFAKIALAAGVSLGVAQAIAIGGAGFILILLLKGKSGK